MKKTCVFQDTETPKHTPDLLEAARRMSGRDGFESHVVLVDGDAKGLDGVFNRIVRVARGIVDVVDPRGICGILETLHRGNRYDHILIPATNLGKMVAPRLAKRLGTGLVPDVIDIRRENGRIEFIRAAYSGKFLEAVHVRGNGPVIVTIRPNSFEYAPGYAQGDSQAGAVRTGVDEYAGPVETRGAVKRLRVAEKKENSENRENRGTCDIRESEILISGGGGVKAHFEKLYRLADALNGNVSASRKLVDEGIAPKHIQVGQSGKTVSPRLYMALGIHGTMQHMAGLRQVDTLISVNTDTHAPICSLSDMVVQGDAGEFLDRLMEKISNYRSENKER